MIKRINFHAKTSRSRLPSIRTVRQFGRFHKTKAIQSAVDTIHDENSIIFLMDLHILVPNTMISLVRKVRLQVTCESTYRHYISKCRDQNYASRVCKILLVAFSDIMQRKYNGFR